MRRWVPALAVAIAALAAHACASCAPGEGPTGTARAGGGLGGATDAATGGAGSRDAGSGGATPPLDGGGEGGGDPAGAGPDGGGGAGGGDGGAGLPSTGIDPDCDAWQDVPEAAPDADGAVRWSRLDNAFSGYAASERYTVYESRFTNVYLRDNLSGKERKLGFARGGALEALAIEGSLVAFSSLHAEAGVGIAELILFDQATCEFRRLDTQRWSGLDGGPSHHSISISDRRVVWEQSSSPMQVVMHDLRTEERRVVSAPTERSAGRPSIGGDWIAYMAVVSDEHGDGDREVFLLNVATGERRQLTDDRLAAVEGARTNGRVVIWADARNGVQYQSGFYENLDLVIYDISAGTTETLLAAPGDQFPPSFRGDEIVWDDFPDGTESRPLGLRRANVWWMDLRERQPVRLTSYDSDRARSMFAGDHVTWLDLTSEWFRVVGMPFQPPAR